MADQDPDRAELDTDLSGQPWRMPTLDEVIASGPPPPDWDVIVELPDGTVAVDAGDGRLFERAADGGPDLSRPVPPA